MTQIKSLARKYNSEDLCQNDQSAPELFFILPFPPQMNLI
uniref:Uncharacterized protein n=1 Tax=Anguilla anguilla TaxID=7936 RepID=A0A0E9REF3_ANGAN